MKADKKELLLFQELDIRKDFKEIKDFGIRAYAIDCGKDYNKAATYVNIILEKVYNVSEGSTITIETSDFNNIESAKICRESQVLLQGLKNKKRMLSAMKHLFQK